MALRVIALLGFLFAAGCQSAGETAFNAGCAARQEACNSQCEETFEIDQNAWDYQSCIASCRPSERSQCYAQ